jgi:hypothetical protein
MSCGRCRRDVGSAHRKSVPAPLRTAGARHREDRGLLGALGAPGYWWRRLARPDPRRLGAPSTGGSVMAGLVTCDWCGHTIEDVSPLNKMLCYGLPTIREWHLHLPSDGYECMDRAVEAFDKICGTEQPAVAMAQTDRHTDGERWQAEHDASLERCHAWNKIPTTEREHQILNALDDTRLCAREIAEKIATPHDWIMHASDVKLTLGKMVDRGDLHRIKEPRVPGSKQFRWLYYRDQGKLSPELAALERALKTAEA